MQEPYLQVMDWFLDYCQEFEIDATGRNMDVVITGHFEYHFHLHKGKGLQICQQTRSAIQFFAFNSSGSYRSAIRHYLGGIDWYLPSNYFMPLFASHSPRILLPPFLSILFCAVYRVVFRLLFASQRVCRPLMARYHPCEGH